MEEASAGSTRSDLNLIDIIQTPPYGGAPPNGGAPPDDGSPYNGGGDPPGGDGGTPNGGPGPLHSDVSLIPIIQENGPAGGDKGGTAPSADPVSSDGNLLNIIRRNRQGTDNRSASNAVSVPGRSHEKYVALDPLVISGKPFHRILYASVDISHGSSQEARQIPLVQFVIGLPLDHDVTITEWALAKQSVDRWKIVELTLFNRSRGVAKIYRLHKAYVHSYTEFEFPQKSGSATDSGNYVEIVIRGVLRHIDEDYDGTNIGSVTGGDPE